MILQLVWIAKKPALLYVEKLLLSMKYAQNMGTIIQLQIVFVKIAQ